AQPPAKPADKAPAPKPAEKVAPKPAQPPAGEMKMSPQQMAGMEAMMKAATPGKEHAHLQKAVGTWEGTAKMWMEPDTTPTESKCTSGITSVLDGRFTHCDVTGDMGGRPFHGSGLYGFDNVSHKYQMTWVDNMGTGMMSGTGELSADSKTMTWSC